MKYPIDKEYYIQRKPELLKQFDDECQLWKPVIIGSYHEEFAGGILWEALKEFEALIPQIPYIGGDENRRTRTLIESIRYLAFYKVMKRHGKTAEETGKILYEALVSQIDKKQQKYTPSEWQNQEKYFKKRKKEAEVSQEQRYPSDYVYKFVLGDGNEFDYGYDYSECASIKFYHAQNADEFMPFYCYLDFPICSALGLGLTRTMTLVEGYEKCNHRFKPGWETKLAWPPPFLKRGRKK
jgi:hypothetical protein